MTEINIEEQISFIHESITALLIIRKIHPIIRTHYSTISSVSIFQKTIEPVLYNISTIFKSATSKSIKTAPTQMKCIYFST